MKSSRRFLLAVLAISLVAGSASIATAPAVGQPPWASGAIVDPLLVAVGDIACRPGQPRRGVPGQPRLALHCHQAAIAGLIARLGPSAIAMLGDAQYDRGTAAEFAGSFAHTWGGLRPRTHPTVGNHDYLTPGASAYFSFFGAAAAPPNGYYSYDLGAWHIVVLNSNCTYVSCASGSPQESWLRADLAAHPARCTLAYWHHPRFSSGYNGSDPLVAPLWNDLYSAGADVVVNGHDHDYERFAPQNGAGRLDLAHGMREFVVGTGGKDFGPIRAIRPNSVRRANRTFGVLALNLGATGYSWRFVPEPGATFRDAGAGTCH
jgi:acid phosphatase type 7